MAILGHRAAPTPIIKGMKWSKNERFKGSFIMTILRYMLYFVIATVLWTLVYRFLSPPFTYLMLKRTFQTDSHGKRLGIDYQWRSMAQLSPNLPLAVMASEDGQFLIHNGFDIAAMQRAFSYNLKKEGKKVRGGSTISQQTAKNAFLWPDRSYIRKGFEVYFTALIELIWGKRRIMEVYLNIVEMGPGIYGFEAAAKHYYGKSAQNLSQAEAAALVSILPSPLKWSPTKPSPKLKAKQKRIRYFMNKVARPDWD